MHNNLYESINFKPQSQSIINTFIYEYDMSKANINVLRSKGILDDKNYQYLYNAGRDVRQIIVGKLIQKDPSISEILQKGIIEAKKLLFESNNIQDWEVLSIKNDAVFIIGRELNTVDFNEYYHFVKKNTYTIFLQLKDLEIYYFDQFVNGELVIKVDVKGINDEILILHQDGILNLICDICYKLQREHIRDTLSYMSNIYDQYINRKFPVNYYREFDYNSKFLIVTTFRKFYLDICNEENKYALDINRNLMIIRGLMYIISSVYSNKK